jgi:hypothetical protein
VRSRWWLLLPVLLAASALTACGHAPAKRSSGTVPAHGDSWSGPIGLAPGAVLSVISCPTSDACVVGSTDGQSYRLTARRPSTIGPVGAAPSPQGADYLDCTSATFCAAVPNLNQASLYNGASWSAPTTIPAAQGFTAIGCVGTTFCVAIDGEGNSFVYDGTRWSGNIGAWGAANQISCVSAAFCIAVEGGPSVWNGRSWSQPSDSDLQGQLNSVSCASTTFCVAVDSAGDVLTWNGSAFSAPTSIASEPPLTGTDASGLTGVSCPTTTFCRAVDSIGRVFDFDGTRWSTGTLIDSAGALTAISCPSISYCAAVDRHGRAYVWSAPVKS